MSKRKSKKNESNNSSIIMGAVTLLILLILVLCGANTEVLSKFSSLTGLNITFDDSKYEGTNTKPVEFISDDNLRVYFIDVGQADSILVMNGNESMLIDAGNNDDGKDVVKFIKEKGIEKLNYLIGTHPHEDHIGGLDNVIKDFEIENIFMPKIDTTTKTFEDVLDAISAKKLKVTAPVKGQKFKVGEAECEVMTDTILDKESLNLSSIVIRLQFGNNSFLFTGDAETKNENTRQWPKTDVLKVGHHGSNTSSSESFLKQVSPQYAIIMAGKDNTYGLPKARILDRLKSVNAKIYRTDENGTIEMVSDGNEIITNTEK